MSGSYKKEQIKDALVKNKGNANLAKSALLKQMRSDDRLFREIAAPFIDGIVSHAIEQFAKAQGIPLVRQSANIKPRPAAQKLAPEQLDVVIAAMRTRTAPPDGNTSDGLEGLFSKPNPARHADVLRSIAKPLRTLDSDYFDR